VIERLSIAVCALGLLITAVQPLNGQTGARTSQIVTFSVLSAQRVDLAGTVQLGISSQRTSDINPKVTVGLLLPDSLQTRIRHQTILPAGSTTPPPPEPPASGQPSRKSTVYTITE